MLIRPSKASAVIYYQLIFIIIAIPLLYSFSAEKHLSADGVNYFANILDRGDFSSAWSRQFANYITQWPLVLAVHLGIKNISTLINIYAGALFLPYLASYLLCAYAIHKENPFLLVFPIISIAGINLSGDYILIGEHHVTTLLCWPILFLLLRKEPLSRLGTLLLWSLLLLFSQSYDTAIFPALIFSALILKKIALFRHQRRQLIAYGVSLLLAGWTILISSHFIIFPNNAANKASFAQGIQSGLFGHQGALATVCFTIIFMIGLNSRRKWILISSLLPIMVYAIYIGLSQHGPSALISFNTRTLTVSFLPLLLLCAILAQIRQVRINRLTASIFLVYLVVIATGNLHFSRDWTLFHSQIVDILETSSGYVPVEQTIVSDSPYGWSWNYSQLGIVWSNPCVKTILLTRPDVAWEPFDPQKQLILKKFIRYSSRFHHVDRAAKICQ